MPSASETSCPMHDGRPSKTYKNNVSTLARRNDMLPANGSSTEAYRPGSHLANTSEAALATASSLFPPLPRSPNICRPGRLERIDFRRSKLIIDQLFSYINTAMGETEGRAEASLNAPIEWHGDIKKVYIRVEFEINRRRSHSDS